MGNGDRRNSRKMLQRRGRAAAKARRMRPRVPGAAPPARKRMVRAAALEPAAPAPAEEASETGAKDKAG